MKENDSKGLLTGYIRQHRKGLLCFVLFCLIFAIVFSLYRLEAEAVFYASLLCVCVGLAALAFDYGRYRRRHLELRRILNKMLAGLEELPPPISILEQDYQELLRQQLSEKQKQLLIQDQLRGEMLEYYTLWAHQIKTPIAAMRLILQEEDTGVNQEITAELFKIEQYVEMVLSYLRLGSSSTDFVIRRQELEPIVRQTVRKYAPLFIRKKIALDLREVRCRVLTDEKWLAFALEQILSNALKYTQKGQISIYLEEPQTLVIADTGIGISAQDLPRLFEKGFTGYNGREDKRATGLGLYLCRRILEKLGHTIRIESEEGRGTRVKIGLESVELGTRP